MASTRAAFSEDRESVVKFFIGHFGQGRIDAGDLLVLGRLAEPTVNQLGCGVDASSGRGPRHSA